MRARWVYRASLGVQLFCGVLNCYAAFRVLSISRHPVHNYINVVQPPVITNSIPMIPQTSLEFPHFVRHSSSNSVSALSSAASLPPLSISSWSMPFHVFQSGRDRFVELGGIYYRKGDRHAFGVVSSIYPERIVFDNGNYIDNTSNKGVNSYVERRTDNPTP